MGRLIAAGTQSDSPAGWNETAPRRKLSRATRPGGSSPSAAARCGKAMIIIKAAHKVAQTQLNAFVLFSMKVSFF
jgi:hypothetical protein